MTEWIVFFLILAGGFFNLVAAVGILRMPDVYTRISATAKAGTLGAGVLLAGAAIAFGQLDVIVRALAVLAFIYLTAPVAAHLIGRAAYRTGVALWEGTVADEWQEETDVSSTTSAHLGAEE